MARIVADQLTGARVHGHRLGLAAARLTQQAVARLILGVEALARGTAVTVVLVAVVIAVIVAVVVVLTITLVVTLLPPRCILFLISSRKPMVVSSRGLVQAL